MSQKGKGHQGKAVLRSAWSRVPVLPFIFLRMLSICLNLPNSEGQTSVCFLELQEEIKQPPRLAENTKGVQENAIHIQHVQSGKKW